jgi:hypothetical protein
VGGEAGFVPGLGGSVSVAGAPTYDDPLCDRAAAWSGEQALANVSTPDADERLLAMTHDALTIVFSRDDALLVADRQSASADFGEPVVLTLPEPYTHLRGVALQDDGLSVIVVESEGKLFADMTRAARTGAFAGAAKSSRFETLAESSRQFGQLSSPVLAPDGSLYFTEIGPSTSRVRRSVLSADGTYFESPGELLDTVSLGGNDGLSKLVQSVSSDERTLFFFDEALGHTVGLWNSSPGGPFTEPTEFPELVSAFSDGACSHLYGTREQNDSLDVIALTAE